jgi:glycosyltransferase involved in cell wall biosynthesis
MKGSAQKMINILYLHGGAELYGGDIILLELLKGLDRNSIKPYVILPNSGPLVEEIRKLDIDVEIYDYPIARRQYFTPTGVLTYIKKYKEASKYLKRFCKDKNIHIVHSNTTAVLEGIALQRGTKAKHIWHIHEMFDKPMIVYKLFAFLVGKFSDHVVTVSNSVKEHWVKTGSVKASQVTVIHNGVDNKRFNPNNDIDYLKKEFNIKEDEIVVGMVGRVNAIKGQMVFVSAMERVFEINKNVRAVLSGGVFEGQEWRFEELKKRIEQSKYKSNFILQEFRSDVENFHCLFHILAFPSIQNDSFSTVILEAMASGKPVVGFKNGGIVEMIEEGKNGMYAEFGDDKSLAEKIIKYVEDKELRESVGKNNMEKQKEHFSVESFLKKFNDLYVEIASIE